MGKAGTMNWDAERERKLFLAIIQDLKPSSTAINWNNVSDMLGYEHCTATACAYVHLHRRFVANALTKPRDRNKLNKIKVGLKKEFGDKADSGDSDKSAAPTKGKKAAGGKKKRKAGASDDDDEEPKAKKVNGGIKAEVEDEAEDDDGLV